jgi:TolA-binding protein
MKLVIEEKLQKCRQDLHNLVNARDNLRSQLETLETRIKERNGAFLELQQIVKELENQEKKAEAEKVVKSASVVEKKPAPVKITPKTKA